MRRTAIGKAGSMMAASETQGYAYNAENRPFTWTKGDTVVTMV